MEPGKNIVVMNVLTTCIHNVKAYDEGGCRVTRV